MERLAQCLVGYMACQGHQLRGSTKKSEIRCDTCTQKVYIPHDEQYHKGQSLAPSHTNKPSGTDAT